MTAARPASTPPGVRIAGVGSALPKKVLTNRDLESLMDTSDEWIVQRTGIHERRISDRNAGETTTSLAVGALKSALADARMAPTDLDLVVCATVTPDMITPATANRVCGQLSLPGVPGFDINAACSSYVFALNVAQTFVRAGTYRTVGVIGADCITRTCDYSTNGRGTAILFGDAGAALILKATDDVSKGVIAHAMHADGTGWHEIFVPTCKSDFPNQADFTPEKLTKLQMNGKSVFRFAVSKFPDLIQETLDKAGLKATDVDHYVCHQSNARILEAARERFNLEHSRLCVNIGRYGNTVSASVPLVFDELKRNGRLKEGQRVMFLGFGAGLTWASSLWQL